MHWKKPIDRLLRPATRPMRNSLLPVASPSLKGLNEPSEMEILSSNFEEASCQHLNGGRSCWSGPSGGSSAQVRNVDSSTLRLREYSPRRRVQRDERTFELNELANTHELLDTQQFNRSVPSTRLWRAPPPRPWRKERKSCNDNDISSSSQRRPEERNLNASGGKRASK